MLWTNTFNHLVEYTVFRYQANCIAYCTAYKHFKNSTTDQRAEKYRIKALKMVTTRNIKGATTQLEQIQLALSSFYP